MIRKIVYERRTLLFRTCLKTCKCTLYSTHVGNKTHTGYDAQHRNRGAGALAVASFLGHEVVHPVVLS